MNLQSKIMLLSFLVLSVPTLHAAENTGEDRKAFTKRIQEVASQFVERYEKALLADAGKGVSMKRVEFLLWLQKNVNDELQLELGIEKWKKENEIFAETIEHRINQLKAFNLIQDFSKWFEAHKKNLDRLEKELSYWGADKEFREVIEDRIRELHQEKKADELFKKWQVSLYKKILNMIFPYDPIYAQSERDELLEIIKFKRELSKGEQDTFFILLGRVILRNKPESLPYLISYLTEFHSLSVEQFDLLLKHLDWGCCIELGKFLKAIIPVIPKDLVNNRYNSFAISRKSESMGAFNKAFLWYCVQYNKQCDDRDYNLILIKQLLDKGADPLVADGEGYQIVRSLPYAKHNERITQMRALLFPLIESQAIARKEMVQNTLVSLPSDVCDLCSEYVFNLHELHNDQLLELIDNCDPLEESAFLEGMDKIFNNKIHDSQSSSMINRRDLSGMTPLMHAAKKGYVKAVKKLIHKGADVQASDENKKNVLWCGINSLRDSFDITSCILQSAKKDKKDIAAMVNEVPEGGADDDIGSSLVCAVRKKDLVLIKLLLDHRADPSIEDGYALNIARMSEDKTMHNMLQQHMLLQVDTAPAQS